LETHLGVTTELAPLVLFVYQRPAHTKKVLNAIANDLLAKDTVLYVYSDGPKRPDNNSEQDRIAQTRALIQDFNGCKEVHLYSKDKNEGLAQSIVNGVSEVVEKHGKVIVLEDDILISPFFLTYMNQTLNLYEKEDRVMHIGSFVPQRSGQEKLPETYFLRFMNCWGWATWKRAWQKLELNAPLLLNKLQDREDKIFFDLENSIGLLKQLKDNINGKINTWAIKWYSSIFLNNGLCLYPKRSLTSQIGLDGSGIHADVDLDDRYQVEMSSSVTVEKISIAENVVAYQYLKQFYRYGNFKGWKAVKRYLRFHQQRLKL
jgi:hypothetical protein